MKYFIFLFQSCKESCLAFNQRRECKCMEYRFPRPPNPTPICNILNKKTGEFVPNTAFTENSNFVYRRNLETKELTYTGCIFNKKTFQALKLGSYLAFIYI